MTEPLVGEAGEPTVDERDRQLLRQAFADAEAAGKAGERPFAGLVVAANGQFLASAVNRQVSSGDFTAHAELAALRRAFLDEPEQVLGATLYASSEPCAMCSAGAFFAGIGRVVFGTSSAATDAVMPRPGRQLSLHAATVLGSGDRDTAVIGPVLEPEGLAHLRQVEGGTSQRRTTDSAPGSNGPQ